MDEIQNNSKNIEVSVIIVSYNNFDVLENCLQSIIKFTQDVSYEIIIVDNNSTEGNIEDLINKFEQDIILIKNDVNKGFAAANNQGIEIAEGNYFLLLNNDVIFVENSILKVINYLKKEKENNFIGCKLLNGDGTHQFSIADFDSIINLIGEKTFLYLLFPKNKFINRYHKNYLHSDKPFEVDIVKGAFLFGTTSTYKKLHGFDEKFFFYSEEADLCFRLQKTGGRTIYYPGTEVIHLGSVAGEKVKWFRHKHLHTSKIKFWQKHFSKLKYFIALIIHWLGILIRIPVYFISGTVRLNRGKLLQSLIYSRLLLVFPKNEFTGEKGK